MAIKGDYAKVLCGLPITVPMANVAVSQPRVRDICAYGEDKFLSDVTLLVHLERFVSEVKEGNDLLGALSDFHVLMVILEEDNTVKSSLEGLFGLIFPDYHWKIETGCIQFKVDEHGPNVGQVNPMNFENLQGVLKLLFLPSVKGAEEPEYNPVNDRANEIAEKLRRGREIRQNLNKKDGSGSGSLYATYVSCLSVGLPMDMNVLLDCTPFQLNDMFVRYTRKGEFDLFQRVSTMPMMDTSKLEPPDSWMGDIY